MWGLASEFLQSHTPISQCLVVFSSRVSQQIRFSAKIFFWFSIFSSTRWREGVFSGSITAQRGLTTLRIKWKTFIWQWERTGKSFEVPAPFSLNTKRWKNVSSKITLNHELLSLIESIFSYFFEENFWDRKGKNGEIEKSVCSNPYAFFLILVVLSLGSNEDKVWEPRLKERDKKARGKLSRGLSEVPPGVMIMKTIFVCSSPWSL